MLREALRLRRHSFLGSHRTVVVQDQGSRSVNRHPRCPHGFVISMQLCVECNGEAARDLNKTKEMRGFRCRKCGARRYRKELDANLTCILSLGCER